MAGGPYKKDCSIRIEEVDLGFRADHDPAEKNNSIRIDHWRVHELPERMIVLTHPLH